MRVAVIFDNFGPYHVARLAAAARQLDILGIETAGCSAEYAWGVRDDPDAFERVTLFPSGTSGQRSGRQIAVAMERALEAFGPDAIAIPGWYDRAGLAALRWAGRHQVPAVLMSDSNADDAPRRAHREVVKRAIVGRCSTGLAAGRRAEAYLRQLGLPADATAQGYDTIDNACFAAGADAARADAAGVRTRLGLPEHYFLSCSRFVEKKNQPFLIEAYAQYARARGQQAWSLVLLGDGALRDDLQSLARRLGVADRVHFPGFATYEELPLYYGLAGGFVLASTVDQWGLVVNEAMACGLPVLVSRRCGCAQDLVQEGVNGFTFDPRDRATLVGGFEAVMEHGSAMGEASRAIIAAWSPARFADALARVARLAVDRPLPPPRWPARVVLDLMLR